MNKKLVTKKAAYVANVAAEQLEQKETETGRPKDYKWYLGYQSGFEAGLINAATNSKLYTKLVSEIDDVEDQGDTND